jgi:hypothetical protein
MEISALEPIDLAGDLQSNKVTASLFLGNFHVVRKITTHQPKANPVAHYRFGLLNKTLGITTKGIIFY